MEEDHTTVVVKIIAQAHAPLSVIEIERLLPTPYPIKRSELSQILDHQTRIGKIHPWLSWRKQRRYWNHSLEETASAAIREIVALRPLNRTNLLVTLKKSLFNGSNDAVMKLMRRVVTDLLKKQLLFEHPPVGRRTSTLLGISPASPEQYLGTVQKEYDLVCKKLIKVGVAPENIYQVACRKFQPSSAEKKTDQMIINVMLEIEPAASQQAPVGIPELRQTLNMPKKDFDQAILRLARQGKIFLNRHIHPAQMSAAEREQMVSDEQGNYYVVAVLPKGACYD